MIYNKVNKTKPILFHAPGYKANLAKYKKINKIWSRFVIRNNSKFKNKNLKILTCNTSNHKGLFEKSLDSLGYEYKVLGCGGNWRNINKINLFYEEIKKTKEKYILGCDSFDVLCLGEIPEINNMIISTESNFFPDHEYVAEEKEFEFKSYKRFLNSGCWLGERSVCLDFFETCLEEIVNKPDLRNKIANDSDQLIFHKAFKKMNNEIKLDCNSEIFQTVTFCGLETLFPLKSIL